MRIVFMGTPDFAVASLAALLQNGIDVVGVVTAPDKPAGRGQKIQESAVKRFAVDKGLHVMQPEKLKDPDFLEELRSLKADLQVVVAFRMLPEVVWNMPAGGTINLHASLLPQYRGAAPINWAIINGEKKTGVSTFFLKQEIDTGDIIFSAEEMIWETDTAGDLHDKLMNTGAALLVKTVRAIESGDYTETSQADFKNIDLKIAPKIFKDDCRVNWDQKAEKVFNHIRGLSPYPTAFCSFQNKNLKIFRSELIAGRPDIPAGEYKSDGKSYLHFACQDAFIALSEIQLEGKKKMEISEFLRGVRL